MPITLVLMKDLNEFEFWNASDAKANHQIVRSNVQTSGSLAIMNYSELWQKD